ncbi:MAG: hypothetical protein K0R78_1750 [Pelosinus sp.]|jgi:hypothetical protein|nr:hypothetical protein [Pelosinus sp.]
MVLEVIIFFEKNAETRSCEDVRRTRRPVNKSLRVLRVCDSAFASTVFIYGL